MREDNGVSEAENFFINKDEFKTENNETDNPGDIKDADIRTNERAVKAADYFNSGYNCTQSVVLSFSDLIDIPQEELLKLASPFGGGMGRLREVCGTVSGMFIVLGCLYGYNEAGDFERKKRLYADVQELAKRFEAVNGSIVCRELLGLQKKRDDPVPEKRTGEYYKKRPCARLAGIAAAILDGFLKEKGITAETNGERKAEDEKAANGEKKISASAPELKPIAHVETDFEDKFGIPRQSGLSKLSVGKIVFEEGYRVREAVRGLEGFSYLWVLWQFSENIRDEWSPTVRPPKLGGNSRMGVFATRSPFRPNPIGLSSVKLLKVEFDEGLGPVLYVQGGDFLDGTPVYDIKPYLPYTDSHPDASAGFTEGTPTAALEVYIPETEAEKLPKEKLEVLKEVLAFDPRPAYHDDAERVYGFWFSGAEVKFRVEGNELTVVSIQKEE